ncbi:MAG: hypothetical protein IPM16_23535 [Chloroflexi bacterium]|nr:hypothetical protein [Chloroflexota bacterium]
MAALNTEDLDHVGVGVDAVLILRARQFFAVFGDRGVDPHHQIARGHHLRVFAELEVAQDRVGRQDGRGQAGDLAGGDQRRHDAVERRPRELIADAGRDVALDLILARLAVDLRGDADPARVLRVRADERLHLVFDRAAPVRVQQAQLQFGTQRAHLGGRRVGDRQIGVIDRRVEVVRHDGLGVGFAAAVARADRAAHHERVAVVLGEEHVTLLGRRVGIVGGDRQADVVMQRVEVERGVAARVGQFLDGVVEGALSVFDHLPRNRLAVLDKRFVRRQRKFHVDSDPVTCVQTGAAGVHFGAPREGMQVRAARRYQAVGGWRGCGD